MLAPTRELVADLNRRAREHRLGGASPDQRSSWPTATGPVVGDVIITRTNDRRLRLSATDWVKNGDRWTVTRIGRHGDLTVRHTPQPAHRPPPRRLRRTSTGLGYATTIHGAQGVSADTMHGLLTGQESRQQLYTMLTRGRHANHLYLQSSATATPTASSVPTRSRRAPRPRRCSRSSPATKPHLRHHSAARAQQPRGPAVRRRPALHRQPRLRRRTSSSDPRPSPTSTTSTSTSPVSPPNPPGPPCAPTCSPSPPKPATTRYRHLRQPRADATSPPPATWPPSSTGDSQRSRPPTQVRCPGSRASRQRFKITRSGDATSPTGASSSPTSPTSSENKPPWPTPIPTGRHSTATSATNFSARSPSGGPQTGSTLATRARPVFGDSKRCHPAGRTNLTAPSPVP